MGFNVARAVGPALGGFVVAAAGPAAVFLLNAASFLGVLVVIYRWRRAQVPSDAPPEDMLGATAAGMRYVRHAPALQAVLVRIGVFILGASALWALLPVVARHDLGLDATGYGIILGSLGLGAVGGALLLPRLRRALPVDTLTAAATLVFAGATLALAYLRFVPLLVVCMMAGGMAWLAMMSSLTVAAQTASPAWVRARALGIYFEGVRAGVDAEVVEQGRDDVEVLNGARDACAVDAGQPHHERHVDRRVVQRPAVHQLAVLEEVLAVVGGEDDDHVLPVARGAQGRQQPVELVVEVTELVVVGSRSDRRPRATSRGAPSACTSS